MPKLTLTPVAGGSPITVPITVDGGWSDEPEDAQVIERYYDGSSGSVTVNGAAVDVDVFPVATAPMSEANARALIARLALLGALTAAGDYVNPSQTVRVDGIGTSLGERRDQVVVRFTLRAET